MYRLISASSRENLSSGFATSNTQTGLLSYKDKLESFEILDLASIGIILSKQRTTKALIRLRGCAGCSASLLFAYGKTRFCRCDSYVHSTCRFCYSCLNFARNPLRSHRWGGYSGGREKGGGRVEKRRRREKGGGRGGEGREREEGEGRERREGEKGEGEGRKGVWKKEQVHHVRKFLEYRENFGKGVRQRSVRSDTTKENAGSLPQYLYTKVACKPVSIDFCQHCHQNQCWARRHCWARHQWWTWCYSHSLHSRRCAEPEAG